MFDYTQSAATANALLEKFGARHTLRQFADTADGVTGAVTRVTTAYQVIAAMIPVSNSPQSLDDRYKDAWTRGKLRMFYVGAGVAEPKAGDELLTAGQLYTVLGCTPLDVTGSNPVIYTVGAESK